MATTPAAGASDRLGHSVAIDSEDVIVGGDGPASQPKAVHLWQVDVPYHGHCSFGVQSGDRLVLFTATPHDGPREPPNECDLTLQLYDPAGAPVATEDNGAPDERHALLRHMAAATRIHTVEVYAVGWTQGPCILTVDGASRVGQRQRALVVDSAAALSHSRVARDQRAGDRERARVKNPATTLFRLANVSATLAIEIRFRARLKDVEDGLPKLSAKARTLQIALFHVVLVPCPSGCAAALPKQSLLQRPHVKRLSEIVVDIGEPTACATFAGTVSSPVLPPSIGGKGPKSVERMPSSQIPGDLPGSSRGCQNHVSIPQAIGQ